MCVQCSSYSLVWEEEEGFRKAGFSLNSADEALLPACSYFFCCYVPAADSAAAALVCVVRLIRHCRRHEILSVPEETSLVFGRGVGDVGKIDELGWTKNGKAMTRYHFGAVCTTSSIQRISDALGNA